MSGINFYDIFLIDWQQYFKTKWKHKAAHRVI